MLASSPHIKVPQPNHIIRDQWKTRVYNKRGDLYVRAVGIPLHVELEPERDPRKIDHVWLTLDVPPVGKLTVSINTLSFFNQNAGYDSRVRLAILPTRYVEKPAPLLELHAPLDYTVLESTHEVQFVAMDYEPLEALLIKKCNAAVRAEVWGDLYIREHLGIHQIHSRRASCAVERDMIGKDGGLRLYYSDGVAELLLFKFCGQ